MGEVAVPPLHKAEKTSSELARGPYQEPTSWDRAAGTGPAAPRRLTVAELTPFSNRGTYALAEGTCARAESPKPTHETAQPTLETEEPAVDDSAEPVIETPRSNSLVKVFNAVGKFLELLAKLAAPAAEPGELTELYQALAYGPEQGGEGVIVQLPLSVLHTKLTIKPKIIVYNPVADTRRLLGNEEPWTLQQLLDESKQLGVELLWTKNDDGSQIIIEGNHMTAQHAPLADQTVHVHTHPPVPRDMFNPEINSGGRALNGPSEDDLRTFRRMPGVARVILTESGNAILYLDTKMKSSGTATWSTRPAPCVGPDSSSRG